MAPPIPRAPPVTIATRPAKMSAISSSPPWLNGQPAKGPPSASRHGRKLQHTHAARSSPKWRPPPQPSAERGLYFLLARLNVRLRRINQRDFGVGEACTRDLR